MINKTKDKAYNLIEEMTFNNYQWSNKRIPSMKVGGKFGVNALTLLTTIVDAMTQRLEHLNVNAISACAFPPCNRYGSFDHETFAYSFS